MSNKLLYKRILLKISGESLQGKSGFGYDADAVESVVTRIKEALDAGAEIALVVGAGNVWRGAAGAKRGMDRVSADHMGMLATVMNALCLKDAFEANGVKSQVHSSVNMPPFAPGFDREKAMNGLSSGELIIFAGGTGLPFFTTDTTAAMRALQVDCQAVMKATKVNGVYTADPFKDPSAKKFDKLSFDEALAGQFAVMDSAAFSLCRDNQLHIIVFDFNEPGALIKILSGDHSVGTIIS